MLKLERKTKQPAPGQPKPPLTKLKELSEDDRAKVMDLLRAHSYEQAVPLVKKLLGFACSQYTLRRFFRWQATQQLMETSEDMIAQVGSFLQESYQDWTEEKMRQAASAFFLMQTLEKRDARAFACIARLGIQSRRNELHEQKLEFEKEKLDRKMRYARRRLMLECRKCKYTMDSRLKLALDALTRHTQANPEVRKLFQQGIKLAAAAQEIKADTPSPADRAAAEEALRRHQVQKPPAAPSPWPPR